MAFGLGAAADGLAFDLEGQPTQVSLRLTSDRDLALEIGEARKLEVNTGVIMWSFGTVQALCPFLWTADNALAVAADPTKVLGVHAGTQAVILVDEGDTERRLLFER